jgi:hypothetical protein
VRHATTHAKPALSEDARVDRLLEEAGAIIVEKVDPAS